MAMAVRIGVNNDQLCVLDCIDHFTWSVIEQQAVEGFCSKPPASTRLPAA
jgi:hypothetical protein